MESYDNILSKLSAFISKYYRTQMIKGIFIFLTMALLFWMLLLSLENFFWLGNTGRLWLFIIAVLGSFFLFFRYLIIPALYLFRLRKGLGLKEAARIIGAHFPEVGDRLVNLIDLASDTKKSELLLASIEQRSQVLKPIPFQMAIDLTKSYRYARLLGIPFLCIAVLWIGGMAGDYFNSFERVVRYDTAFERPAPFRFVLLTPDLRTVEKKDYTIFVSTEGDVTPDQAQIVVEGKERIMQEENGKYTYTFSAPYGSQEFYFKANGVRSRKYVLETLKAPTIQRFNTVLKYPEYVKRQPDTLKGTGNAVVPEGTIVNWQIWAENTDVVKQLTQDTIELYKRDKDRFNLERKVMGDLTYEISTSNDVLSDYERLSYSLKVIKDASPKIAVEEIRDTITNAVRYEGRAADDYQIRMLRLFYFEEGKDEEARFLILDEPAERDYVFVYEFPTGLDLQRGIIYNYFFQVTDNDALRGGKKANSRVFTMAILDKDQEEIRRLEQQREVLKDFDKGLDTFKEQQEKLMELEQNQKEKNVLDYNDQKALSDFLKSQQQQEALMEKFSKQLQETLGEKGNLEKTDKLLKERLERQELEARKNERLLEELQKMADKIDKEELAKKLEEVGKRQQNNKRSLSQLLELTKKYYVTEKANEIARKLEKLAEKQELLSRMKQDREFNVDEQEKVNNGFEEIEREMEELRKANSELSKALPIDTDKKREEEIREDLNKALEEINRGKETENADNDRNSLENNENKATASQRKAAAKMKQMAESLQQSAMSGGGESMAEDAEMLRQILENLIVFSFKQEALLDKLNSDEEGRNYSVSVVREEQQLRSLFEHVDDSLFALSLRQAEITEFVNEQITEVYYNIDNALDNIAEGQSYRAAAYQQSVVTSANNLADFLADVLNNMQQSLAQGQGSGSSKDGFQLPDIIRGQQEIEGSMNSMGKKNSGQDGEEGMEKGKKGEGDDPGGIKDGKEGKGAQNGNTSEEDMQKLYEIYKQQQMIREKLEKQLEDMINLEERALAERLARQMEEFERDLIENGITNRTLDKVNRIKQQLMRLENAAMEQGQKEERESSFTEERFNRPLILRREDLVKDKGVMEILQRQALPLRDFYGEKAKKFFWDND